MKVEISIPPDVKHTFDPKRGVLTLEPPFYRAAGQIRDLLRVVVSGKTDRRKERVITLHGKEGVLSVSKIEEIEPGFDRPARTKSGDAAAVDEEGEV